MNAKRLFVIALLGAVLLASAVLAQTAFSKPSAPQAADSAGQVDASGIEGPGWRTPQTSKHYPPFIPTPGWRTPQTSNYTPNNPAPQAPKYYPTPGWYTPPMN